MYQTCVQPVYFFILYVILCFHDTLCDIQHMDGMKKSPVLNHADHLMPVVEVHGLHKVAEIAGTRASRKKSVAHNEMRYFPVPALVCCMQIWKILNLDSNAEVEHGRICSTLYIFSFIIFNCDE